jgi:hypothetical protein
MKRIFWRINVLFWARMIRCLSLLPAKSKPIKEPVVEKTDLASLEAKLCRMYLCSGYMYAPVPAAQALQAQINELRCVERDVKPELIGVRLSHTCLNRDLIG